MSEQGAPRFRVQVVEGAGHGDLYELEQSTYFHVVDTRTEQIVLTFEGSMSASMSRSTGQWDDYTYGGVRQVTIAPDQGSVRVMYYGEHEETVPLPQPK